MQKLMCCVCVSPGSASSTATGLWQKCGQQEGELGLFFIEAQQEGVRLGVFLIEAHRKK